MPTLIQLTISGRPGKLSSECHRRSWFNRTTLRGTKKCVLTQYKFMCTNLLLSITESDIAEHFFLVEFPTCTQQLSHERLFVRFTRHRLRYLLLQLKVTVLDVQGRIIRLKGPSQLPRGYSDQIRLKPTKSDQIMAESDGRIPSNSVGVASGRGPLQESII